MGCREGVRQPVDLTVDPPQGDGQRPQPLRRRRATTVHRFHARQRIRPAAGTVCAGPSCNPVLRPLAPNGPDDGIRRPGRRPALPPHRRPRRADGAGARTGKQTAAGNRLVHPYGALTRSRGSRGSAVPSGSARVGAAEAVRGRGSGPRARASPPPASRRSRVMSSATATPLAPGRLPLIGHAWQLWRDPLEFLLGLRTVGKVVRVGLGRMTLHFVTDPELVHQVLVAQSGSFERGTIFQRAGAVFGEGLVTSDGERHRTDRRMIQPGFRRDRLDHYTAIMSDNARKLAESWHPGERVDVNEAMYHLAITNLTEALFSCDLERAGKHELADVVKVISQGAMMRAVLPPSLTAAPLPVNRRFAAAAEAIHATLDRIITERRARPGDRQDLLALLLSLRDPATGAPRSDQWIRDQAVTMLNAGVDTTASTLTWAFHELGRHPEIRERVEEEVDAVVGRGPVGPDQLAALDYTDRFLKEVARLHSFLMLIRRTTDPVELGGVRLPAGAEVAYSLYALHRDPELFPDPERLDPGRWSPGERPVRRDTWLPFGAGVHKCIGDTFSWAEMLAAVAAVTARHRLAPAPGTTVRTKPAIIPKPDRLPMIVRPRQGRGTTDHGALS
ncbi:cytochrome P450 [Streptomyces tsukubensis NRRL18488]|uniref:Cytochrome P450 n=2 Tax=Streptomyces TaxID=1883 RepID=A0A7G3UDY3_STRT9|nr:cytochrome P450 [Streptomyces tsukubensis NRRL18488]